MTTIALYPWETTETVTNEQIEAEILADAEFQQWLDALLADSGWLEADGQQPAANSQQLASMGELEFLAYAADQAEAQSAEKMLRIADQTLRAPKSGWGLRPEWQRYDYVGS